MVQIVGEDENGRLITEANYANYIRESEARVSSGGGAGDIEFNAAGIDKVINEIKDIIDLELRKATRDATNLYRRLPTDVDPVSGRYVRSVNDFGEGYEKWTDNFIDRLKTYVEKLEKIKKNYLAREEDIGGEMSKPLNT